MAAPVVRLPREDARRARAAFRGGIVPAPSAVRAYTLPWPPSVNHYWRMAGRRMVLTEHARAYHAAAKADIWRQAGCRPVPWSGPLAVTVQLWEPPDARRHDIDNVLKALLDVCTLACVWEDDSQVRRLVVDADRSREAAGRAQIAITPRLRETE